MPLEGTVSCVLAAEPQTASSAPVPAVPRCRASRRSRVCGDAAARGPSCSSQLPREAALAWKQNFTFLPSFKCFIEVAKQAQDGLQTPYFKQCITGFLRPVKVAFTEH